MKWLRTQRGLRWIIAQPERIKAPAQRRDFLRALGIYGNVGHPELLVIDARTKPARILFCELKVGDGRTSAEQDKWELWLSTSLVESALIRSVEDLQRAVG